MALKKQNGTDNVLLQSGDLLLLQDESAGGADNLLADDVSSTSEVTAPSIGQEHGILADDVESASELTSPVVGQEHDLTVVSVESASELTVPVLTAVSGTDNLLANDVESASEVAAPLIGQDHALLANGVSSSSETGDPQVGQEHALTTVSVESASDLSSTNIGQEHGLASTDVESATELTAPAVESQQPVDLLADDVSATSEVSVPDLGVVHNLEAGPYDFWFNEPAQASKRKGGRVRKPKRYLVEIDGVLFDAATVRQVEAILDQAEKVVTKARKRPVIKVKTLSGPTKSKVIHKAIKRVEVKFNRIVDDEISELLQEKLSRERIFRRKQEEAYLTLML